MSDIPVVFCNNYRCIKIKIVDFTNTPLPELCYPGTTEPIGIIGIEVYAGDSEKTLIGTYAYELGKPELVICNVPAGWIRLKFLPRSCKMPNDFPPESKADWSCYALAADMVGHKAIQEAPKHKKRPSQLRLSDEHKQGWDHYLYVQHGTLYLPEKKSQVDDKVEVVRPEQSCSISFMLDKREKRCPKCDNLQTSYLLELGPLLSWVPALALAKLGAKDDWDAVTANNLAALATLAYAEPDSRKRYDGKSASYPDTILYTVDNLRTRRTRPHRIGANDWLDMILLEVPYSHHYHSMEFYHLVDPDKNPTDSQCYLITNRDTIIIGVRGTASKQDAVQDIDFTLVSPPAGLEGTPGAVHKGFADSFISLWRYVYNYILRFEQGEEGPRSIFVTGHSLGGAVSTLLACAIVKVFPANPLTLYTYAAPRVATREFAQYWNAKVPFLRHVYNVDMVPALPPADVLRSRNIYFSHFGHLKQLSYMDVVMYLAKDPGVINLIKFLWISDYNITQPGGKLPNGPDNAPWGPHDSVTLGDMYAHPSMRNAHEIFSEMLFKAIFSGASNHFMKNYYSFLHKEMKARVKAAEKGVPLLGEYRAYNVFANPEMTAAIRAYGQRVTMEELTQKHISDLHPHVVVAEEIKRFCKTSVADLEAMKQEHGGLPERKRLSERKRTMDPREDGYKIRKEQERRRYIPDVSKIPLEPRPVPRIPDIRKPGEVYFEPAPMIMSDASDPIGLMQQSCAARKQEAVFLLDEVKSLISQA